MSESRDDDGIVITLFERNGTRINLTHRDTNASYRYASQEALESHEKSSSYQEFFKTVTAEGLMAKPPQIVKGEIVAELRR